MLRSRSRVLAGLLATPVLLAACTSGSTPDPSPSTSVATSTSAPSTAAPTPVASGPTVTVRATSCPLATQSFVKPTIGMRLGRLTVLRSGGRVVGCRFYAFQGGALHVSEHLPGPNQPAVEITTQRYASANDAHNAFVLRAGSSASVTQVAFDGVIGLCFPTDFDPQDKGNDFACTVNTGSTLVLVRTVDTAHSDGTASIVKAVLRAVAQ